MTAKVILRRRQAQIDVERAAADYCEEGGVDLELRFLDALSAALAHIGTLPRTGSTRYADQLGFDELRFWPLKRFPYLVFYIEQEAQIDVLRVLHAHQNLPEWLL